MRWVISMSVLCMEAVFFNAQAYQQSEEARPAQTQQTESSESWSGSIIDTLFEFSSDKGICLHGWMEIEDGKQLFTDYALRDCDTSEILGGETSVLGLGGSHLSFSNDTLWVSQIDLLAMGENLEFVKFPWKIKAYYLEDGSFGYTEGLYENFRYDQQTIESVLKEYETTELRTQQEDWEYVDSVLMRLANKLLIAAISGSEKSEMYFKEFKTRVKPDGIYGSWYIIMENMLKFAKGE